MKIKEKINVENILCLFIIMCPVLDILSFGFRSIFNTNISPSTIIRPIIPIIITAYLFFKGNKNFKLYTFLGFIIYAIYGILHLYFFQKVLTGSSYGNIVHEGQYIVNYSFMILNLFLYIYIFKTGDATKLRKSIVTAVFIYMFSIYIAILTNTTSYTYPQERIGFKGWLESGNSISAILILAMFAYTNWLKEAKYKKIIIPLLFFIGIFLVFLIGTRVGLIGFILVLLLYIIVEVLNSLLHKIKINKKFVIINVVALIIMSLTIVILGSSTIKRRKYLRKIEENIIDEAVNGNSHITGDLLEIKNKIDTNKLEEGYMNEAEKKSILELYNIANKLNIANNDQRMQQLIYNIALVKNQKNLVLIVFGNGYLANFRELVMEMEIPAFLLNFGIVGFTLYFVPFLTIFIYGLWTGLKNLNKIDDECIMFEIGCGFAFAISFFSGYTFFNSSSMMIIIVLNTLLINKICKLKEN